MKILSHDPSLKCRKRARWTPQEPKTRAEIEAIIRCQRALFEIQNCCRPNAQIIDRLYRKWRRLEEVNDGRRTRTPDSFRFGLLTLLAMFTVDDEMKFKQGEFCGVMRKIQSGEFAKLVWKIGGVRWTKAMQRFVLKTLEKDAKILVRTNPFKTRGRITELWLGLHAEKLLEDIKAVLKSVGKAPKKMPVLCRVAEDPEAARRRAVNHSIDPNKGTPSLHRSVVPLDQKKSTPSASLPGVEVFPFVADTTGTVEKLGAGGLKLVLQKLKAQFPEDDITEIHIGQLKRWWSHRQAKCRLTAERFEHWLLCRDAEVDADGVACTLDQFCRRWFWVWRNVRNVQLNQTVTVGTISIFDDLKKCAETLEHDALNRVLMELRMNGPNIVENLITPNVWFDRDHYNVLCRFVIAVKTEIPLEWLYAFVEPVTKIVRSTPEYFVALADAGYPIQEWLGLSDAQAKQIRSNAVKCYGHEMRERALVQAWATTA